MVVNGGVLTEDCLSVWYNNLCGLNMNRQSSQVINYIRLTLGPGRAKNQTLQINKWSLYCHILYCSGCVVMFVVVILKQILLWKSFYIITVNCLVNIYLCEFPTLDCDVLKMSSACVLSPLITLCCVTVLAGRISIIIIFQSFSHLAPVHRQCFESPQFYQTSGAVKRWTQPCWHGWSSSLYWCSVSSLQRLQIRSLQQNYSWRLSVKMIEFQDVRAGGCWHSSLQGRTTMRWTLSWDNFFTTLWSAKRKPPWQLDSSSLHFSSR